MAAQGRTVSVALLGAGTVGPEVARLLAETADDLAARVGFSPDTPIEHGIARFVDWYRSFYKV